MGYYSANTIVATDWTSFCSQVIAMEGYLVAIAIGNPHLLLNIKNWLILVFLSK